MPYIHMLFVQTHCIINTKNNEKAAWIKDDSLYKYIRRDNVTNGFLWYRYTVFSILYVQSSVRVVTDP